MLAALLVAVAAERMYVTPKIEASITRYAGTAYLKTFIRSQASAQTLGFHLAYADVPQEITKTRRGLRCTIRFGRHADGSGAWYQIEADYRGQRAEKSGTAPLS